ncbi:hypothetical protein QTN79_04365 [Candidatus Saccharibacteria bacterium oral taxon 488]|jgi:hypothetical protein
MSTGYLARGKLPHEKAAPEEADAAFVMIRRWSIGLRRSVGS